MEYLVGEKLYTPDRIVDCTNFTDDCRLDRELCVNLPCSYKLCPSKFI